MSKWISVKKYMPPVDFEVKVRMYNGQMTKAIWKDGYVKGWNLMTDNLDIHMRGVIKEWKFTGKPPSLGQ